MAITVEIPATLRAYCGAPAEISVSASTPRAVLRQLEISHPQLYNSVCDETGALRQHVNLFVNLELIRGDNGLDSRLQPADVVAIMPAVSGG